MTEKEKEAYEAGLDCGRRGANTTNCHYRHFATQKLTKAWEAGKNEADNEQREQK